jgi:hypothetical protein
MITIQQQPMANGSAMLSLATNYPSLCVCPYCQQSIVSRVEKSAGPIVWLAAAGLCLFGFVCGCCLIPFCIHSIKVRTVYCDAAIIFSSRTPRITARIATE